MTIAMPGPSNVETLVQRIGLLLYIIGDNLKHKVPTTANVTVPT